MRLGDLDALKEEVGSWGMNDYEPADFIDAIDNAPTVEQPVGISDKLQGEWEIVDAEGWKIWNCVCTECGHDPQEYIGGTEDWWLRKSHLPNFCPNCGVRIVNVKGGAE